MAPPATPTKTSIEAELGPTGVRWLDRINVVLLVPIFGIIYMQSHRIHTGWITNYGNDVFGTAWAWWIARRLCDRRLPRLRIGREPRTAELTVLGVFCVGLAYEVGKLLRWIPGTYDPLNLIPYGATLAVCYFIERVLRRAHSVR
jgi:hypothetical protein